MTTTFKTIADGLDAAIDGRGWNGAHEKARTLANAAPDLLEACKLAEMALADYRAGVAKGYPQQAIKAIGVAIARAEGRA